MKLRWVTMDGVKTLQTREYETALTGAIGVGEWQDVPVEQPTNFKIDTTNLLCRDCGSAYCCKGRKESVWTEQTPPPKSSREQLVEKMAKIMHDADGRSHSSYEEAGEICHNFYETCAEAAIASLEQEIKRVMPSKDSFYGLMQPGADVALNAVKEALRSLGLEI